MAEAVSPIKARFGDHEGQANAQRLRQVGHGRLERGRHQVMGSGGQQRHRHREHHDGHQAADEVIGQIVAQLGIRLLVAHAEPALERDEQRRQQHEPDAQPQRGHGEFGEGDVHGGNGGAMRKLSPDRRRPAAEDCSRWIGVSGLAAATAAAAGREANQAEAAQQHAKGCRFRHFGIQGDVIQQHERRRAGAAAVHQEAQPFAGAGGGESHGGGLPAAEAAVDDAQQFGLLLDAAEIDFPVIVIVGAGLDDLLGQREIESQRIGVAHRQAVDLLLERAREIHPVRGEEIATGWRSAVAIAQASRTVFVFQPDRGLVGVGDVAIQDEVVAAILAIAAFPVRQGSTVGARRGRAAGELLVAAVGGLFEVAVLDEVRMSGIGAQYRGGQQGQQEWFDAHGADSRKWWMAVRKRRRFLGRSERERDNIFHAVSMRE